MCWKVISLSMSEQSACLKPNSDWLLQDMISKLVLNRQYTERRLEVMQPCIDCIDSYVLLKIAFQNICSEESKLIGIRTRLLL